MKEAGEKLAAPAERWLLWQSVISNMAVCSARHSHTDGCPAGTDCFQHTAGCNNV